MGTTSGGRPSTSNETRGGGGVLLLIPGLIPGMATKGAVGPRSNRTRSFVRPKDDNSPGPELVVVVLLLLLSVIVALVS